MFRVSPTPSSCTLLNAGEPPAARFSVLADVDERYTSVVRRALWKCSHGFFDGDLAPITTRRFHHGLFEVIAQARLTIGQHGFVPQITLQYFLFGARVYSFGGARGGE